MLTLHETNPEQALEEAIEFVVEQARKEGREEIKPKDICYLPDNAVHDIEQELRDPLADFMLQEQGVFYHVAYADQVPAILEQGIFHDESPTLTPSLALAIRYSLFKGGVLRSGASILRVDMSLAEVELVKIQSQGPGFLPKQRKNRTYAQQVGLHPVLENYLYGSDSHSEARWVNPEHIRAEPVFHANVFSRREAAASANTRYHSLQAIATY